VCNGNLPTSQRSIQKWYDTSCFVSPAQYSFGNTGRNVLIGPGQQTVDFSLGKDFRVTEGRGLQFRVETFNLLNHANFDMPGTSIGSGSAGKKRRHRIAPDSTRGSFPLPDPTKPKLEENNAT
jgi:hypothetical protein